MNIDEMLELCIDAGLLQVEIYDCEKDKVVWRGYGDEVPDKYVYEEISTWDVPCKYGTMTFNIF